ncbi:hypothetical protein BC829DRAFT_391950 [Chytridium lagenaria]|nr:hypothetical protein BC829DRAFT_391950 [Chytridium lagenaria]
MPKNKGKGGKNRKANENESEKRELVFKEDGQEYALVAKMLGNGWIEVSCIDGEKRLAHIRGAFRKKVWITVGDVVLLGLRDFQDSKADVILKYTPDEARMLKSYGEIPENIKFNETELVGGDSDEAALQFRRWRNTLFIFLSAYHHGMALFAAPKNAFREENPHFYFFLTFLTTTLSFPLQAI